MSSSTWTKDVGEQSAGPNNQPAAVPERLGVDALLEQLRIVSVKSENAEALTLNCLEELHIFSYLLPADQQTRLSKITESILGAFANPGPKRKSAKSSVASSSKDVRASGSKSSSSTSRVTDLFS